MIFGVSHSVVVVVQRVDYEKKFTFSFHGPIYA